MGELGKTIKMFRQKKGVSQIELAEKCKVSQTFLSQIENGKRSATMEYFNKICNALEIPFPIISFLSLEEANIPHDKRESFQKVKPIINNLLEGIFE